MLDAVRITVSLICLGATAYQDLEERLVDDRIWFIFFPMGVGLFIIDLLFKPLSLFYVLYSLFATGIIALIIAVLVKGKNMGSADLIAICYIALSMPLYADHFPIFDLRRMKHPFFPMSVILNSCLISLTAIPYNMMRNIKFLTSGKRLFEGMDAGIIQKVLVFLLATPVSTNCIRSRHFIPVERNNSGRRVIILPKISIEDDMKKEEVWATIGMPMIFLYFISFIFSLIFGGVIL